MVLDGNINQIYFEFIRIYPNLSTGAAAPVPRTPFVQ